MKVKSEKWTAQEVETLKEVWQSDPWVAVMARLPNRSRNGIIYKAAQLRLTRWSRVRRVANLKITRLKYRLAHIEESRQYTRNYRKRNIEAVREQDRKSQKKLRFRHFFRHRAESLASQSKSFGRKYTVTEKRLLAAELSKAWKKQRGCCALTGRRLGRGKAHVDHIIPRAKGGEDFGNTRWVCADANHLKRALSDQELYVICQEVVATLRGKLPLAAEFTVTEENSHGPQTLPPELGPQDGLPTQGQDLEDE